MRDRVDQTVDDLEKLRSAALDVDGVVSVRFTEALVQLRTDAGRIWIRPPSRGRRDWTAHFFMGERHRFKTLDEVVEWLGKQADPQGGSGEEARLL